MNTSSFRFVSLGRNQFIYLSNKIYNDVPINELLPFDLITSTFAGVIDCFKTDFQNYLPTDFITTINESGYDVLKNSVQSLIFNKTNFYLNKYEIYGEYGFQYMLNNQISLFRTLLQQYQQPNQQQKIIFVRSILNYDDEITNITIFNNLIQELYPTLQYQLVIIIENQGPNEIITQFSHNINDKTSVYTLNANTDNLVQLNEFFNDINEINALFKPIYDSIINQ